MKQLFHHRNVLELSDAQIKFMIRVVVLCALLVHIIAAWPALTGAQTLTGDEPHYFELGVALAERGSFELVGNPSTYISPGELDGVPSHPTAYRMPLFPLVIAPVYWLVGPIPYAPQPLNILFGILICYLTFVIGSKVFNPMVGLIGAIICVFAPLLIEGSRTLMTENLFTFLVMCSLLLLEKFRTNSTWKIAFAAGVVLGLTTLTRATFGMFVPLTILWIAWHKRKELTRILPQLLIMCMMFAALWGLWVGRNWLQLGAPIAFTTQGGSAYYGIYHADVSNVANSSYFGYWHWFSPPISEDIEHKVSEIYLDQLQRRIAAEWAIQNPALAIMAALAQAFHFWRPEPFEASYYSIVMPLFLLGLFTTRKNIASLGWLYILLTVMFILLSIVSVGVPRYRTPIVPLISIFASAFMYYIFVRSKSLYLAIAKSE